MSKQLSTQTSPDGVPTGLALLNKIGLTVNVWSGKQLLRSDFDEMRSFLDEAAAAGFGYAELGGCGLGVVMAGQVQRSRLAALRDSLADCPLRLTLHSAWFSSGRTGNLLDATSASVQYQGLRADLEVAAAIGAEVLVYHAGVLANRYSDGAELAAGMATEREQLRDLADEAGARGIMIAVENRAPTPAVLTRRSYGMRLDLVAEQVREIDHPQVSMCLDVGHAYLAASYLQYDYLAAVKAVAPLVGHLHFHDNFGRMAKQPEADAYELELLGEGDLHLPPGWGTIPLAEVLAVPYPREPAVIIEMRHARHYAEALETTRGMLTAPIRA
ncbi:sugar phosphate isomerase/epimerase [Amycolatopsis sp. GM8]|uniref:sugar phosphate isomerase/epimerase family protein n=1 Tax=Amycolatopsis sp. GM8 TaxID=2896530 RepID=UPI001F2D69E0|nr:sugar phosphate isomerase/epimerase [Amycolatopsis sp. GM8]